MPKANARDAEPEAAGREGGSLTWAPADVDMAALQQQGWTVMSFRDLHEQFIAPARARTAVRRTLANPAQPLLDLIASTKALAVVGVSLGTAADLRDLYGFVIEPAYRRGATLLVAVDRDLDDLDPELFIEPLGYAWTLERLRYIASRFMVGAARDGLPPMTPIEDLLFKAMRKRDLAPVAQYGIGPYRADFAFPEVRLVVECDGRQWHDPGRDAQRDAALRRLGWEPLHFTGSEINVNPAACASRVFRVVKDRRATVNSEQPQIAIPLRLEAQIEIPLRLSLWARFLAWLQGGDPKRTGVVEVAIAREPTEPLPVPKWARHLDSEQQAAVGSGDGVVQVIAPAGSGKTTVLVARVQELVARGVAPNRVLCCTFNAAAAEELQDRLDQLGVEGVKASTFHAVGRQVLKRADLLRKETGSISYGQWRRLSKLAMDQTEGGVWIDAPDAKEQVSSLKLARMLTVDEFAATASTPAERTLATIYRLYEETQEQENRTDFDDFIFGAVRLLQRDPAARRHWQDQYTSVLVDEHQDIEPAQELLIQMLAAPEDLLFCVGDEDQCLYAWRRATVERVIELDQIYPGLERHALARNYRCPSLVVDASRSLIEQNRRRFPKQIVAVRPEPGEIILAGAAGLQAEAAHAARLVKGLQQGDAVILARTTRVLSEVAVALAQAGIRFYGPERIKRTSGEPAVLLAYLRLLGAPKRARPEDVDAAFRIPNRYLPDDAEVSLASGLRAGLSFTKALARIGGVEAWRREKLYSAGPLFDALAEVEDAGELIRRLRSDGGLDRHYADAEQLNPTDKSAVDTLASTQELGAGMTVIELADALDYQSSIIEQHFDKHGIELATIHGAKGRQWPLVIVAGIEEGEMPHARSLLRALDDQGELEGERRLAYVAFTRAKDRLVLLFDGDRPSRFIAEAALGVTPTSDIGDHTATANLRSARLG